MMKSPTGNSTMAIGEVSSPLDSFVVAQSSVYRTNFCAEKPAHRQSANCYWQIYKDTANIKQHDKGNNNDNFKLLH